jgi:hypothetical protein
MPPTTPGHDRLPSSLPVSPQGRTGAEKRDGHSRRPAQRAAKHKTPGEAHVTAGEKTPPGRNPHCRRC